MAAGSSKNNQSEIQAQAARISDAFPQLLIDAERVAQTVSQGIHGRRRIGQGESFWQYRPFDAGDGSGLIDWRRSAKSDALYVRETEWEAAQSIWLWRDHSPSMDFSSDKSLPTKRHRADLLCLAIANLLNRSGERFGLIGEANRATTGRAGLNKFYEHLFNAQDPKDKLPQADRIAKYSDVVLMGDFLMSVKEMQHIFSSFAARHIKGHIIQILDPAEETLPYQGRVHFMGMENEGDMLVPKVQNLRASYRKRLLDHRQGLIDLARHHGWDVFVHHTDNAPETALMTLFMALSDSHRSSRQHRWA